MGQAFVIRYQPLGDSAVLVTLSENITPRTADRVLVLDRAVREAQIAGVDDCVPAYTSLLVKYNPAKIGFENLTKKIQSIKIQSRDVDQKKRRAEGLKSPFIMEEIKAPISKMWRILPD